MPVRKNKLTPTETKVLNHIARGLTSRQIATKLHIGFETVMTHRRNMLRKHKVNNMFELLRLALIHQWL